MANPFDTGAMAAGYAKSRPRVHPHIIELASPFVGLVERALDVGCGAGLSTRALSPVARECVGLEPAESMLRWSGEIAPEARFVVGSAERLPFADDSFDLLAAAGSLNYVRLEDFFPEARRVLRTRGQLLVYDFAPGRSFRDGPQLDGWFDGFLQRYPPALSEARKLDPEILRQLDSGMLAAADSRFEIGLTLDSSFYLEYILTGTNVAAALRRGERLAELHEWCARTLLPAWGPVPREVLFRGYFVLLAAGRS